MISQQVQQSNSVMSVTDALKLQHLLYSSTILRVTPFYCNAAEWLRWRLQSTSELLWNSLGCLVLWWMGKLVDEVVLSLDPSSLFFCSSHVLSFFPCLQLFPLLPPVLSLYPVSSLHDPLPICSFILRHTVLIINVLLVCTEKHIVSLRQL